MRICFYPAQSGKVWNGSSLYSEALGEAIRLKIAASTLRTIEKKGGLDAFLLDASSAGLDHDMARLRERIQAKRDAAG